MSLKVQMRVARPTDRLDEVVRFYRDGLAFDVVGSFEDHDGFDGVILGHARQQYHLEFTTKRGHSVGRAPTPDNLLVFYIPDVEHWRGAVERMRSCGYEPVESFNPYWGRQGRTFEDPDGYRVVLQNAEWSVVGSGSAPHEFAVRGSPRLPKGWTLGGSHPGDYDIDVEPMAYGDKPAVCLRATASEGFGTIAQVVRANAYRGQRLRFSAALRSYEVARWAGLWMRVDDMDRRTLAFDNMQNRALTGTTEWARHAVVLDVAERESLRFTFGVLMSGPGQVWIAEVQLEVVAHDVQTTGMSMQQEHPINLDFAE